jgi:hypothetical protein
VRQATAGLACLLALPCLAGCGSADETTSALVAPGVYPPAVAKRFTKSCTANARLSSGGRLSRDQAGEICGSELECLEGRLSFAEFVKTERKMLAGEANPGAKVLLGCAKSAVRAARGSAP